MRLLSLFSCAAVFVASAALGQEAITIKLKPAPDVGKSVVVKEILKREGTIKIIDPADMDKVLRTDKIADTREETYTETVLAKKDTKVTKYKRSYEKASRTVTGQTQTRSYEGKTVIFEEKDGKYQISVEGGGRLEEKDEKELLREANDSADEPEKLLLPARPVKAGDRWTIEPRALASVFGKSSELDLDRTKGEGTLVKTYSKDGKPYGVIDLDLKLAVKSMEGIKFEMPAVMDLKLSLDSALDGSTTAGSQTTRGKMSGKGTVEPMGQKFTLEMNIDLSGKKEQSAEK